MTSFPTAYTRAPTMLFSQQSLRSIQQTNSSLLRINEQLASGLDLLRPSDDPVRSATVSLLDGRISRSDQVLSNLGFATGALDTLDVALGDAKNLIDEALGIASEQISTPTDAETRASQATIVESLISSLFSISNRDSVVGHIFGGTAPGRAPVEFEGGGYRFVGGRGGLLADLGGASDIPLTLGADNAVGALSARVDGTVDLNPDLTLDTRLSDLNGARDLGVPEGEVQFRFNVGPVVTVDLSGADTVGDVVDTLESAIRQYETDNAVTILGPGGVSISGDGISIDVPAGDLAFNDIPGSFLGLDLGLINGAGDPFNALNTVGTGLDPRVTWTTPISALAGLGGQALDQVELQTGGQSYVIDLSGAQTMADIRSAFEAGGTNVVVELSEDGTAFSVKTSVAGLRGQAMSISEVTGGNDTATILGIRTLSADTPTSAFNDGTGVDVLEGEDDFIIELGDGFQITIDLSSSDMGTVGSMLAAINAQADAQLTAAARPTTDFLAELEWPSNGLAFVQDAALAGSGPIALKRQNTSPALDQLGFMDATLNGPGTRLVAEDRASVRVDNLFTHLLDLAEALRTDDTLGIQVATDKLTDGLDRVIQSRSVVGGYARRIQDETTREEDRQVLDIGLRSELRDLDFASASSQFAQLQLQLQAGLSVASQVQQLTLLDFLG